MRARLAVLLLLSSCVGALRVPVPRRQVLASALSAAALAGPGALPALAKSKTSMNPNKQCNDVTDPYGNVVSLCAGANAKDSTRDLYKAQKASMSGDKVRAVVAPAGPPMMISGGLRARARRRAVMGCRAKQLGAAMHALVSWGPPCMHSGRDGARLARPTRTLTLKPKPQPRPTPRQGSRGTELDKDFEKLEAERR